METDTAALVEQIRALILSDSAAELIDLVDDLHPADIVDILESLDYSEREAFFRVMPVDKAGEILGELEFEDQTEVLQSLGLSRSSQVIREMYSDDAADLIGDLPAEHRDSILNAMSAEGEDVRGLLRYDEDSSGGIMATEYVAVRSEWTVDQALSHLRSSGPDVHAAYYLYVVDASLHLVGVVSLRELVIADLNARIADIMDENVQSVHVDADQEEVVQTFQKYRYLALPVVDDAGVLTGVITADDVLDVAEEEATEDIQKIAGVVPLDKPYFATRLRELFKSRIVWLMVLFLAESITGHILQTFSDTMKHAIELTFFIPLLIDSGGNAGSQAATTVIRGLAVRDIRVRDLSRVFLRELSLGLILGGTMAAVAFLRAGRVGGGYEIPLVVAVSVFAIITMATTIGALLPLAATVLKMDPATMSAPLVTTIVDGLGLTIYFFVARAVLLV